MVFVIINPVLQICWESSEKIAERLNSGIPIDILFLDFQKAFDTVPHDRLMVKLKAHGIDGNILRWISSWLQA